MLKNAQEAVRYIKENDIVNVDLKACDLFGKWRHLTTPARYVTEEVLAEDFGFDGSSYGFTAVKTWIKRKRDEEAMPVMLRPHPYEFQLSYSC